MKPLPHTLEVTAILDPSPRYTGTSHEDATARAMGYRAALLPGAFVYGHVTRLALDIWGEAWLARGRAQVRFRRPVFSGDTLRIVGDQLAEADGLEARVTVTDAATGAVVLDGSIGLTVTPPQLPPDFTVLPLPAEPTALAPGMVPVGRRLGTATTLFTPELVKQSLRDFHETAAVYAAKNLVHSGMLVRRTMSDTLSNFTLPMPVIFAGLSVQMLALAPIGQSYTTAGRVVRAWERKGKHYFDSEEWLLAGEIPVARHIRTNLYAVDLC